MKKMKKIYYLSTCTTCKRIISDLALKEKDFEFQDIKFNPVSGSQLEEMKQRSGSYESLFSRRAVKYKSMGLAAKELSENDYRDLILSDYTFLKRPVVWMNRELFIGNSPAVVDAMMQYLNS